MHTSLLYEVAIGLIPGIGCHNTKQLISYCGSAEKIFRTPKGKLQKIPGIGEVLADSIVRQDVLFKAEQEILWATKKGIEILFYTHPNFPERLRHFSDAPALLFFNGNANLNAPKTVGIVGTRQATNYGKEVTEAIIHDLKTYEPIIISGLAYGIDIHAHRTALAEKLSTVAVMASGADIIYPAVHKETAQKMLEQGGLLTEYRPGTKPDPAFFPARNRIVAGLCDVIIVVEAAQKGGALITAEIANSYNREVFAVPGNIGNKYNEGCNMLIKSHKAHIYTSVKDLEYILNWDIQKTEKPLSKNKTYETLTKEEQSIAHLLLQKESLGIDELSWTTNIPIGKLSSLLLSMEFQGLIKTLPGKKYKLII
ncbi:MAG TPA: DNA-processing protein DprA [Cytophagaceae bacterium]|nr:DNA-processing protein DprA [Cytophagaceae bacterium]